jgi:Meckelin (Transmembrane protein 67)
VLYCSLDYQNLILFILVFSLFDRVTGNSIISIMITYIVEKLLKQLRDILSEKNLSNKTLIDERFLI